MYIIAGLGNPEKKYFGTRHNAGFHAIDFISQKLSINVSKLKCKSMLGEGTIGGEKVVLVKPQTYMNASGEAIYDLLHWYKADVKDIIILYDDISLAPGKIRIREKGSAGGHNGIKSIISYINTDSFNRIKIGVGSPPHADFDMVDYVLGKFSKEEQETIFKALETACSAVEDIIKSDVQHTMNQFNGM